MPKDNRRFKVISLHPWTGGCNLNCSFCYSKKKRTKDTKNNKFWYDLIPYFKKLTPQIALGADGEPFMNPNFIMEFSKLAKQQGIITNVTTNGRLLTKMNDKQLKDVLKNITMVSISWDNYKIKTNKDKIRYLELVRRIKKLTKCQVGCNLLIDKDMDIVDVVDAMFKYVGVHRIFALFPKNMPRVDILKWKVKYYYLTAKYEHFYLDDASKMIIEQNSYGNWKTPCHRFRDMISLCQNGSVMGCSFDTEPLMRINKPKDIMKILEVKTNERYSCPYIMP